MISMLVLIVSRAEEKQTRLIGRVLLGYLCVHVLLLVVGAFCNLIYYFDEANVYHRAPDYLLSNLCTLLMRPPYSTGTLDLNSSTSSTASELNDVKSPKRCDGLYTFVCDM